MSNRISKREIAEAIAKKTGVRQVDAKNMIDGFIEEIKSHFKAGHMIELRGLGTFYPYHKKARTYKVPRLMEEREMKARTTLKFKPSRQVLIFEE